MADPDLHLRGGGVYLTWAFIGGGAFNTTFVLQGGRLIDMKRLFESGLLLDHIS